MTVNFTVHAKAFRQMHRLERRRDAANILDTGTQNIARTRLNPLRAVLVLAAHGFRTNHRNLQFCSKPRVRRHRLFIHDFLYPSEIQRF
ncbi:hypothetical protein D3C71_2017480 [compost metagenome]